MKTEKTITRYRVTARGWVDGNGWSYTTDLDPATYAEYPVADYTAQEVADGIAAEYGMVNCDDCLITLYASDDDAQEHPIASAWCSDFAD